MWTEISTGISLVAVLLAPLCNAAPRLATSDESSSLSRRHDSPQLEDSLETIPGVILPDPIAIVRTSLNHGQRSSGARSTSEVAGERLPASSRLPNPTAVPASTARPQLTKCSRVERIRKININGCLPLFVDVGQCNGGCNTRLQPLDQPILHEDGVYKFPVRKNCKCCSTRSTMVKPFTAICRASAGSLTFDELMTVFVEVIHRCQCKKCAPESV